MNTSKCVHRISLMMLSILSLVILFSMYTVAANSLTLEASQSQVAVGEEVKISVKMVDEYQNLVSGETNLLVKLTRGGLSDPMVLIRGLTLVNGRAELTYIAPSTSGNADIVLIDLNTNLSAKLSIKVVEGYQNSLWKNEFAVITNVKGKVAVQMVSGDTWDSALVDTTLQEGDTIRTWEDSWVTLQLFDGTEMVLEPWTTLYIESLKSSTENAEVKQSIFKVATGKVLCKVKEYLEKGSRFEIETESSTAGIRGTYFELIATIQGGMDLLVFEGKVVVEHRKSELLFPVRAGEMLTMPNGIFSMPELIQHSINPEERDRILEEDLAISDDRLTDQIDEEHKQNDIQTDQEDIASQIDSDKPGQTYALQDLLPEKTKMDFGSEVIENMQYMTLQIQPEFHNIMGSGISFGVNLAFYQDFEGKIRFGSPDEEVKLANIFNWLEYDGKYVYGRYGYLNNIDYGFGLLMRDYQKPGSRGFQLGFDNLTSARIGSRVLLPFDIKSLHPWKIEETSTLYAGRITTDFRAFLFPFRAGVSVVSDQNIDLTNLDYAVPIAGLEADLSIPLTSMVEPYLEVANLMDFGFGAEAGVRGQALSMVWYQGGIQVLSDNFIPNYFGTDYEEYKKNSLDYLNTGIVKGRLLPDLMSDDYVATQGFYGKAGINLGQYGAFNIGYEDYSNLETIAPIVSADCILTTPALPMISQITAGLQYRQIQFDNPPVGADRWLNENTRFSWYIKYPLVPGMVVTLENRFKPANDRIEYESELGVQLEF